MENKKPRGKAASAIIAGVLALAAISAAGSYYYFERPSADSSSSLASSSSGDDSSAVETSSPESESSQGTSVSSQETPADSSSSGSSSESSSQPQALPSFDSYPSPGFVRTLASGQTYQMAFDSLSGMTSGYKSQYGVDASLGSVGFFAGQRYNSLTSIGHSAASQESYKGISWEADYQHSYTDFAVVESALQGPSASASFQSYEIDVALAVGMTSSSTVKVAVIFRSFAYSYGSALGSPGVWVVMGSATGAPPLSISGYQQFQQGNEALQIGIMVYSNSASAYARDITLTLSWKGE